MIRMKSTRIIRTEFDWVGDIPDGNSPRGPKLNFFTYWGQGDLWWNHHLLRCESQEEMIELFHRYQKRMKLRYELTNEDFAELAKLTWEHEPYQKERQAVLEKRRKEKQALLKKKLNAVKLWKEHKGT